MPNKFGRNYSLFVQTYNGNNLQVIPPFTLEFDISRKIYGSANTASFRVYNLNQDSRNSIRYNFYNVNDYRECKLFAGYGNNLSLIFSGNIYECHSYREGVNFVTTVECYDSGFAWSDAPYNQTHETNSSAPLTQTQVIKKVINYMGTIDPNVSLGVISQTFNTTYTRGQALSDPASNVIQSMIGNSGGNFFIENGIANVLADNEYLPGTTPLIDADTGLLNTPMFEQSTLSFDILFDPTIKLCQLIQLQSLTNNMFNGRYRVTGISHHGTISDAVCGDLVTSITCNADIGQFALVNPS